jgi:hypothetical protein
MLIPAAGDRGLLIYCSDYHCSHWTRINADQRAHSVQLSDFEPGFVRSACPWMIQIGQKLATTG